MCVCMFQQDFHDPHPDECGALCVCVFQRDFHDPHPDECGALCVYVSAGFP